MNHLRDRLPGRTGGAREEQANGAGFGPLHALAAELLLITGLDTALGALTPQRRDPEWSERPVDFERPRPTRWLQAAGLLPAVLAPLAAAAHLKQVLRPTPSTSSANRLLSAAVLAVGLADLVAPLLLRRERETRPSLAPLALASAGLLGLVLERQEQTAREEHRRLERRASVVERLVPQRRPRVERIVVHV